jgi:dipeptidyl aminopeptidase/acylaminoacyl peptidase
VPALPLALGLVAPETPTGTLTPAALWALPRLSSPRLAPDRKAVVFERVVFQGADKLSAVWVAPTEGGPARALTAGPSDKAPNWRDDGVWFLSARSGTTQVWRIDPTGGEASQVTRLPLDVGAFAVAADHVVVLLDVFPDTRDPDDTKARLDAHKATGQKAHAHEGGYARHWDSWKDGRRSVPFAVPLAGGAPVALVAADADAGSASELTVHPNGRSVLWIAQPLAEEAFRTGRDLWVAPLHPPGPARLALRHDAGLSAPSFSPDGKQLAVLRQEVPGYESDRWRVVVHASEDGSLRPGAVVTDEDAWDRSPTQLGWLDDGALWAVADDLGRAPLFRIDVRSGRVTTLTDAGSAGSVSAVRGTAVFLHDALDAPPEVAMWRNGRAARLTALATPPSLGAAEPFQFAGARGETVHGWVVRPVAFDATRRAPLALVVHGGPQGSMADHWHWRWNAQVLAAAGYAVVLIDFHGSTGYGQAFTDSITGDWGGAPLEDLQRGLDAVLAAHPWIDGDRAAALGGSYGGYMMNWIAGRWPDRFRCLVNHAGVFSTRGLAFDTEELFFADHDFGGMPWEVPEAYDRVDPSRFVDRWRTPMLLLHGRNDFRVTESHALGAYNALQRRGVPVRLVMFDEGSHWILRAPDGLRWWQEVLAWLDRWTGPR